MVYFTPTDGLKERWEGALADEGLPLRFPEEMDVLEVEEEIQVTWVGKPRLIELPPGETRSDFPHFEIGPRKSDEEEDDPLEIPALLRDGVLRATHEAFFTTSAGRSAGGLALQAFGAAALAKASGGVVLDPQERGYMSADEALVYAHEMIPQYRAQIAAEKSAREELDAGLEELDRRWQWFRGAFFASCAVWVYLVAFMSLVGPLGIKSDASWVPVALLFPFLAAAVLVARSTRYFLETMSVPWPLPWLIGVLCVFPPIHAVVYWQYAKRYRTLRARLGAA